MKLSSEVIQKMMEAVKMTREHELDCGHCYDEIDQFVELELSGKNAAEVMPLVQEHLDLCGACREEYQALLDALKAVID
jgi:bacterioferritin-associated ferredoxin